MNSKKSARERIAEAIGWKLISPVKSTSNQIADAVIAALTEEERRGLGLPDAAIDRMPEEVGA